MWQVSLFIFIKRIFPLVVRAVPNESIYKALSLKKTRLPNLIPQYPGVHVPILEKLTGFDLLSHFFAFGLGINIVIDIDTLFLYVVNMLSHTAKKCKENDFLECSATIFSS